MSFLSSTTLNIVLPKIIKDFEAENIKHGAYELCLGNEFYTTDLKKQVKDELQKGDQIIIKPGQFAFLITKELVSIPKEYIAFISIKYGIKARGLINISGFHVDPGFSGRLKFSVYNAGSQNIILTVGEPAFLIWFSTFDNNIIDPYKGIHQNQSNINSEDIMKIQGRVISPASLNKEIKKIKVELNIHRAFFLAILITILTYFVTNFLNSNQKSDILENKDKPQTELYKSIYR